MPDLIQQAIVGLAAVGAAAFLLRGVVGALRRPAAPPGCERCPANPLTSPSARPSGNARRA